MQTLGQRLGGMFYAAQSEPKPGYPEFRRVVRSKGLSYKLAGDGYIELSNGECVPHYGCWIETAERVAKEEWAQ